MTETSRGVTLKLYYLLSPLWGSIVFYFIYFYVQGCCKLIIISNYCENVLYWLHSSSLLHLLLAELQLLSSAIEFHSDAVV